MSKASKTLDTPRKLVILDPVEIRRILRQRRAWGGDRLDEVWNGVYLMSPMADNEHQWISFQFSKAIDQALGNFDALVFPGVNISDREQKWKKNYRCPDVAVFLQGNPAQNLGTHWFGGPDFAIEILSKRDRARKKLPFYAKVGVRELLIVDRQPWALELYRRQGEELVLVTKVKPGDTEAIVSEVLGLHFRLVAAEPRTNIEVVHPGDGRSWRI